MKTEDKTIWSIGHSTRPFSELIDMLQSFNIELVADIRSFPGSRKFPQYNKEILEETLPQNNILYKHFKVLGGRRKQVPGSLNTRWQHTAFRGYADYMETNDFKVAADELEKIAQKKRTAFMCAEGLWWRCHRSTVADYLKVKGWEVLHIMGVNKTTKHPYTQPACITNGSLCYHEPLA